ncbi:hypothetical protein B0A48_02364 [Cryoendolithus antarcticus]|uniref:Cytochrome b5 heme-binding domain-containing protein n=1 Tax=Cryoendolithus antarcticus TaxID=1507870 RepID=A0A1V8TNF9_9PEZI|nr:hypothetical protein B0A48_02364 [Cryoendolithus antarcticus]
MGGKPLHDERVIKDERPGVTELTAKSIDSSTAASNLDGVPNVGEGDSTPKAKATNSTEAVPTFSLSASNDSEPVAPAKPAANISTASPQSAAMPPPVMPRSKPASASLMPPPKPKAASLMPPPSSSSLAAPRTPMSSASLRIPSTGPLPNRGPPTNSAQRAGSSGKGKVLLSPGHSPMDWAALSRNENLSGVPTLQRVTPSMLKAMTGRKGKPAWSSYQGKVYNITPYLPFHPGGEPELMKGAGRDGAALFMEAHPWVNWEGMMGQSCLVGIMVSESEAVSQLDEMD